MYVLYACVNLLIELIIILFSVLGFALQAGDDPTVSNLIQVHEDLEIVRRNEYGNCFLRGKSQTTLENAPPKSKPTIPDASFKFWSRENEYFRIDTFSDENYETLQSKLVVRPDGYFVYRPTENGLALVGSGTKEDGLRRLVWHDFFQGSTRLNFLFGESFFANYAGISKYSIPFSKETKTAEVSTVNKDGNLVVTSTIASTTAKCVREVSFSLEHPHVIKHYEVTTQGTGGEHLASGEYEYGSDTRAIAKRLIKRDKDQAGVTAQCITDIFAIELGPQPLEIFDVDRPMKKYESKSWMWVVFLAVVTVFIVAMRFIRRRKGGDVR